MPDKPPPPKPMPQSRAHRGSFNGRKKRGYKKARKQVAAAVSMPPDLYLQTMEVVEQHYDNNFSGYVRSLIRRDLHKTSAA